MKTNFAKFITSEHSPLVLQLIIQTESSEQSLASTARVMAVYADQLCMPTHVDVEWVTSVDGKIVGSKRKLTSLPQSDRLAPQRVNRLFKDMTTASSGASVWGWEVPKQKIAKFEKCHFWCETFNYGENVSNHLPFSAALVVRMEHLLGAGTDRWREFVLRAVSEAAAIAPLRCGVADIIATERCCFGESFLHFRSARSFHRVALWARWIAAAKSGKDVVPWLGQAGILSANALVRCGGIDNLTKELRRRLGEYFFTHTPAEAEELVDPIPAGGAVVWFTHKFDECLLDELEENDIDVEDSITHRAAIMYLTLQDFGVAL